MNRRPISMRLALTFAWSTYRRRYRLFTAVLLTMAGAWAALEVLVIAGQRLGLVWWVAAHVAFFLVFAGLSAGFLHICLACYDGAQPTYADTFRSLNVGPALLAAELIYLVVVIVGLALLVVPGMILGVRYALVGFDLVDGETHLLRAFQHSARLSRSATPSLLAIGGVLLVLNVLGACLVGLGLFLTVPLSGLAMAAVFRQLRTGRKVL